MAGLQELRNVLQALPFPSSRCFGQAARAVARATHPQVGSSDLSMDLRQVGPTLAELERLQSEDRIDAKSRARPEEPNGVNILK